MLNKFPRMAAFYKGQSNIANVNIIVQRLVKAGIPVDMVKIFDGNRDVRAFVLQYVYFAEYRGDVFFDGDVRYFFDNYNNIRK